MVEPRTYVVSPSWVLPDLPLPDAAAVVVESSTVDASLFDTTDRALCRRGVSVVVAGDECTVHLPSDEFSVAATGRTVPREIQQLLLGLRGGKRLEPAAKTETRRQVTGITSTADGTQAEIVVDEITATAVDRSDVIEQRNEITLTASDDSLRKVLDKALRKSGAQRTSRPRTEPVLALTSLGTDAHAPKPAKNTLGALLSDYLDAQHDALLEADIALRRGHDVVHAARVAARRYRSVLRVLADVVDADRAASLEAELQWFAAELGAVRDAEVQRAHLDEAVHALPVELVLGPVAARIDEALQSELLKARSRLDREMRGRRYLALLADLEAWRDLPPVTAAADGSPDTVRRYLHRAERKLANRLRGVKHGDDATLHHARKAAKRARYTAELATPALGSPAKRIAKQAKRLQTVLGDHQDSVVACRLLLRLGAGTARVPTENGFTYGLLCRAERDRADDSRAQAVKAAGKL